MSFPRYPKYKASGVEWLGDVPEHWGVMRFQRCVDVAEGQVDPEDAVFSRMSLIAPNHIESGTGRLLGLESATEQGAESGKYLCKAGDVVYSKIRPALRKVCIAPEDCLCSADMYPLRSHSGLINPFLFWLILSEEFSALAVLESERVAMPKINRESLKAVVLAVPSSVEQTKIASFLDRETSKIDGLVGEQRRLMELLKEKRQAVISHAVTKGLNPHAPLKPSGIEWLGDVPEHWEMKRLGWICTDINDINHEMPTAIENGVLFLSAKDLLDDGTLNFETDVKMISEDDYERLSKKIRPRRGDIIYSRIGAALGKARLVETDIKFNVSYSCCVVRVMDEIACRQFIRVLLDGEMILTEARMRTNGIGVPDLGLGEIARFPIPLPPLAEQRAIVTFLEHETKLLTGLIAEAERGIELLQERRTALISAAVTGQIDVRGLVTS